MMWGQEKAWRITATTYLNSKARRMRPLSRALAGGGRASSGLDSSDSWQFSLESPPAGGGWGVAAGVAAAAAAAGAVATPPGCSLTRLCLLACSRSRAAGSRAS